jgi:uncharacterized protein YkwD
MQVTCKTAALLIASLTFFPTIGFAQRGQTGAEQALFDSANRERTAQGLSPMRWDSALARAARDHALRMAQQNSLSHQLPGEPDLTARATRAGARFSTIAENVAEGPSAAAIHAQWMKSPPHRANLLDDDLDSIGIAVAERNGMLFAVEDFARAVPSLSLKEQEAPVSTLLETSGLRLLDATSDARRTCALDRGYVGKTKPLSVVRYETADVSEVPRDLEQKIESGRYHSAAVGACAASGSSGFARYRLAILLY